MNQGGGPDAELTASAALPSIVSSERRFRAMVEHGVDVFWLVDADGRIAYASPSTERVLGYAPAEVVGTSSLERIVDEDRRALEDATIGRLANAGAELRARHKDGSVRWIEISRSNLLSDPTVAAIVWCFRDVTARKVSDGALREHQGLLEAAQAVAQLGSWASGTRPDLPITWSPDCARIFGREFQAPPTVVEFMQMIHPLDRQAVIEASERAVAERIACETEHRIVRPSGEVRWVHARAMIEGSIKWTGAQPVGGSDNEGREYHVIGVVQDTTERKRVDDDLRASEARYRRIVNHTSEGVWMYDASSRTTFMNPRMAEILGTTVEDAVGQSIHAFMDEKAQIEARVRVARRTRGIAERGEFRLTRRDGADVWVSLHADPLLDEAGNFESALVLVTDITHQRASNELRRLLASIVESSRDAIISLGLDGCIRTWNRGAERLTQYTAGEAIGRPISILYPPEDASALDSVRVRVDAGQQLEDFETVMVRKDGASVEVSVTSSTLVADDGSTAGASIIVRDVSERRKSESVLRRTEAQLAQAQKMQAIGSLAGGVAHDFNNLLSVILSYTEMILADMPHADPSRTDLEEVHLAGYAPPS